MAPTEGAKIYAGQQAAMLSLTHKINGRVDEMGQAGACLSLCHLFIGPEVGLVWLC